EDKYFPVIGDKDKGLIEYDEEALAGIYSYTFPSRSFLEATVLYKRETSPYASDSGHTPDRFMYIAGLRTAIHAGQSDQFTAEIAVAMGEEDPDRDIEAWAGLAEWKHTFAGAMKPRVALSLAGLSGDDPDTSDDEGWSPPFARWPKYSELYIYSQIRERGVANWSNLWFACAECIVSPVRPLTVRFSYYRLMAFHEWEAMQGYDSIDTVRGDLFEIRADISLLQGLTGHILYEYNAPGRFFQSEDAGHFFRIELNYAFAHGISW
ncbi:hypothetical protein JXA80_13790, partial [bacterium]|nr:hypothetical protein [candidate division CSSED10-310 bacterium]